MSTSQKPDFLLTTVVDDAAADFGALFERKFGHALPEWPHHMVSYYRRADGALVPLSYSKFFRFQNVMLVGGCCTDGRAYAAMTDAHRDALAASGGSMVHVLRHGFLRFAGECEAYFGYCGDPRAWDVDIAAGFEPAGPAKLLAHWHKPIDATGKRALVAMVDAIGPF
jgi:hypothetical protein